MSKEDYDEFRSNLKFIMLFVTRYINRLELLGGIQIPTRDVTFESKIDFTDDSMLVHIDPYILNEELVDTFFKQMIVETIKPISHAFSFRTDG